MKSKIFISIVGMMVATLSMYHYGNLPDSVSVKYIQFQYAADFSNDKILMGSSHNVFVGKVIEQVGAEGSIVPETQFSVEVVDNIKGKLKGAIVVSQEGGYMGTDLYVVGDKSDFLNSEEKYLLQPGSTYLFATRYNNEENWHTLNSYPTAKKLISEDNLNKVELEELVVNDSRVEKLKQAYKNEILLETDIKNNNTLNNYKSLKNNKEEVQGTLSGEVME